jgi:hypothetical protein
MTHADPGSSGPRFLVLSEDGSDSAVETVAALTRSLCRQAVPTFDSARLRFTPPTESHRRTLTANRWKSAQVEDQAGIIDLVELITAQLNVPNGFVIFHFDGDRPYVQHHDAENPKKFEAQIISKVRLRLQQPRQASLALKPTPAAAPPIDPLTKLLVLTPYYNVEAWTYYNTRVLRTLCRPDEVETVDTWGRDPSMLEEIEKIGTRISPGKAHNSTLAQQSFPGALANNVGKSFADTVRKLKENGPLMTALSASRYQS